MTPGSGRPLTDVLSRLDHVKKAGGSYAACCPAHDDRHPSLKITETDDGKVLLKCWAGCSAQAIVRAAGLELRDLFPANDENYRQPAMRAIVPQLLEHLQLVRQIGDNWTGQGRSLIDIDLIAYENSVKVTDVCGTGDSSWMEDSSPERPSDSKIPIDMDWDRIETQAAQRTATLLMNAVAAGDLISDV